MSQTISADEITGIECRFAFHIPARNGLPDVHLIKEQVHLKDGRIVPRIRLKKDFKRSFFITKKQYQNHKQKKEWEDLDKLDCYSTTQTELTRSIAKAMGKPWSTERYSQLANSPYLYGSDVSSTSLIKQQYREKYPGLDSPWNVAYLDIETNVLEDPESKKPILITIVFKDKLFTAVLRDFVRGFSDPVALIQKRSRELIGDYLKKHNIAEPEVVIYDTEYELVAETFKRLHEWKPDFLSIWNMDFDVPHMEAAIRRAGCDPKDVFSDPAVPGPLRSYKYKQGKNKRITASGKVIPINPAAQWHVVKAPSSFYIIDGMCVYRQLRLAKQEEQSYSLDAILEKNLGIRKLKFEEAKQYVGLKWHEFMQKFYKIEYIVYNQFDSLGMQELNDKIRDLDYAVPINLDAADPEVFNSQSRKNATDMHFFCLSKGKVFGTLGDPELVKENRQNHWDFEMDDDYVEVEEPTEEVVETLGVDGWVVTLAAHLSAESGLRCIAEDPSIVTNMRGLVYDIDAEASYPSDIRACNVSKETTKREIVTIDGIDEYVFRMQNINILSGPVNAVEYCTTMFGFPQLEDLVKGFNQLQQVTIENPQRPEHEIMKRLEEYC
jgi:hypothetical protein